MKKISIILIITIFQALSVSAQFFVKGTVQDSSGLPLTGAIIRLKSPLDSIAGTADINGSFVFKNLKGSDFTLSAAFLGFQTFVKHYKFEIAKNEIILPVIKLGSSSSNLSEVVVTAVLPVKVKEDTLEFNAKSYAVREGDAVEEVLKKLPGVTVDKDGNVTTQGKPITKIRVNGKDFFGTDVATAIQNLPADIVKNLQVIDDYGDQARLTGIKSGEPEKILNINIEEDKKKGYYARGTGGMGNEDRYLANIRANTFKDNRQFAFNATMNNTNIRGGAGDGITNSKGLNLNYRNEWNKLSADGGYGFNNRDNSTTGTMYRQTIYSSFSRFDNQNNTSKNQNNSHNFWGNIEYKFDTLNYIKLSPNFSFNNSTDQNFGLTNTIQQTISSLRDNRSTGNSLSANAGTNLFFNHKFLKAGRNFSIWSSIGYSKGESDADSQNDYINTDSTGAVTEINQNQLTDNLNNSLRTVLNLSYTEPLSKTSFLELSYNHSRTNNSTSRDTREVDNLGQETINPALSNLYEYNFTTQRLGLNYKFISPKYNYTLGMSAQPAFLEGLDLTRSITTNKKTFNWIPSARLVYYFSKQKALTANYYGRSNQPGFTQLQPLTDNSNLQNTIVGNPDLKPEFNHGMNLEYNQSDWNAGYTLFSTISFNQTNDKIVTTRDTIHDMSNIRQRTSYINTDGFYNLRGNYTYVKPFNERKYTLTFNGGAYYNNYIAFANSQRNIGRNLVLEQGLKFRVDFKDIMDAEINTSYSINKTKYSLESSTDRQTNKIILGLSGRNYFFKDLTFGYDFSKNINQGFVNSGNPNPMILNLMAEYRFLKGNMGSLRLQGFDLFNENTGISRDVFDNEIVDRQTNRLARYFLLSFNLRLRKFGGS
ncbi:outer membrane beta-barrel protein [Pedobacter sp. P351]|uniref:outer membrane beta-barrel protein n=1 Tax=Pedobacter superstes TaxID=3133441 RepID=UPI0030AAD97D